jgi:predicted deacylase
MIISAIVFLLIASIIICYHVDAESHPVMQITSIANHNRPKIFDGGRDVLFIAGSHGNEPAPGYYLNWLTKNAHPNNTTIVPFVNIDAINKNVRSVGPDINRSWPNKTYINRRLLPFVHSTNLIVDFHEAWGFRKCNPMSLGQTIYTNDNRMIPVIDDIVTKLNSNISEDCHLWQRIAILPDTLKKGTLDQYCDDQNIPYILVEMAGQNDVVPVYIRIKNTEIIVAEIVRWQVNKFDN